MSRPNAACHPCLCLQDKSRKCNTQSTQDTIQQFLDNGQEVVNHRNQRREQTAQGKNERTEEGERRSYYMLVIDIQITYVERGKHTQPQRRNNLIQRPTNLLNNQRQLSRQARRRSLARLNQSNIIFIALGLLGGAHGFDVVGGRDDEVVDGCDLGGEG